ncbi:hypothetical protein PPERSA_06934 [Pseudocohnilembus persalinus]|uniref:Peptidase M14 domain-containing protein n=1 Tax=Pseudocohnilembus persalinus TaxID=266149 RepID=A0A0V0QYE8_PSEPJ|nr:hypothetical protein PPERSA_06934 [Pseudocohnilembus persalinus]|eukprot:KRX07319.1 hypothetical protein PPERSA_06934 [Pseudocohnilembus persalinus]
MEFMQAIDNIREKSESVQVNMEEDINKIHNEFFQLKNSSQFKKIYKTELEKQSTSKMDFMIYQAEQLKDEEKRRKFFMQLIQLYPEKNIIKHVKNHNQTKSIKKAVSEIKEYKKLKDKPTKYLFNKEKSVDALAKPLMMPQKFKVRHFDTKTQIDFKKPVEIQFFNYEKDNSPIKNQQKNGKKKGQLSAYDLEKQLKEIKKNHEKDLKEQQKKVDYIYHLKQQYQKKLEKEQEQIEQEYRLQQQIQENEQKQKQKQIQKEKEKDDCNIIPNQNQEKTEEDEENQEQQKQQQEEEETESEEENDKNQDQDKKLVTWDKYGFFVQQKQQAIPVQRKVKRIFFEDIKKQYLEKRKLQSTQLGDLYEQEKTHESAKFESNQDKAAKNLLNKFQANKQNFNQLSSKGSDLNIQKNNNYYMSNQTSQQSISKQSLALNKQNSDAESPEKQQYSPKFSFDENNYNKNKGNSKDKDNNQDKNKENNINNDNDRDNNINNDNDKDKYNNNNQYVNQNNKQDNNNEGFIPAEEKKIPLEGVFISQQKINKQLKLIRPEKALNDQKNDQEVQEYQKYQKYQQDFENQEQFYYDTKQKLLDQLGQANPIAFLKKPQDFLARYISQAGVIKKNPIVLHQLDNCKIFNDTDDYQACFHSSIPNSPLKQKKYTLYQRYNTSNEFQIAYQKYTEQELQNMEIDREKHFAGCFINLNQLIDHEKDTFKKLEESDIEQCILNKNKKQNEIQSFIGNKKENASQINQNQNTSQVIPDIIKRHSDKQLGDLVFDSKFECGNLWSAYTNKENEYELILQNDINSKGYSQWFYFSIANTKKNQTIKLSIVNYEILCHSISQNAIPILTITSKDNKFDYNKLIQQKIDKDNLENKENKADQKEKDKKKKQILNKKIAFVIARQHPGETISSHVMHGFLDYLMENNKQVQYLLENYVFKIVPMVNCDGVIYGNFRCSLAGIDLNRQWTQPHRIITPAPYFIKNMISRYQQQGYDVDVFADLHGHSKKANSFIYACHIEDNPVACRVFPKVFSKMSEIFSFKDCTYGINSYKSCSARGQVFNILKTPYIFTVETSFFGYMSQTGKSHFTPEILFSLGSGLANTLYCVTIKEDKTFFNFTMSEVENEIVEFLAQSPRKQYALDDSGSDSDALVDEINDINEINAFLPTSVAKSIGLISNMNYRNQKSPEKFRSPKKTPRLQNITKVSPRPEIKQEFNQNKVQSFTQQNTAQNSVQDLDQKQNYKNKRSYSVKTGSSYSTQWFGYVPVLRNPNKDQNNNIIIENQEEHNISFVHEENNKKKYEKIISQNFNNNTNQTSDFHMQVPQKESQIQKYDNQQQIFQTPVDVIFKNSKAEQKKQTYQIDPKRLTMRQNQDVVRFNRFLKANEIEQRQVFQSKKNQSKHKQQNQLECKFDLR